MYRITLTITSRLKDKCRIDCSSFSLTLLNSYDLHRVAVWYVCHQTERVCEQFTVQYSSSKFIIQTFCICNRLTKCMSAQQTGNLQWNLCVVRISPAPSTLSLHFYFIFLYFPLKKCVSGLLLQGVHKFNNICSSVSPASMNLSKLIKVDRWKTRGLIVNILFVVLSLSFSVVAPGQGCVYYNTDRNFSVFWCN